MPHTRTTHHLRPYGLALLAFLAVASAGWGKVVYVNKNAPGAVHDGLSWATASLTVTAGLAVSASGDEVWVAGGTYIENITLQAGVALYGGYAGTETARGQRDWQTNATVLADDNSSSTVVTSRYLGTVLDGFTVRGNGSSDGVYGGDTVANCVVSGHNYGIIGSTFVTNCTISGNNYGAYNVAIIAHNTISGNAGAGVQVGYYGHPSVLNNTISGNAYGVMVVGSYFDNGHFGTAYFATAGVTGNLIIGNQTGVLLYVAKPTLFNNTVCNNVTGVANGFYSDSVIAGNVVAFNSSHGIVTHSSAISRCSHNAVYGNAAGDFSGYTPLGSVTQDPLFLDRSGGNFHLQAGSPCIDAGDDAVVTAGQLDLDGDPRISGPHVDIGAFEYTGAAVPYTFAEVAAALKIAGGLVNIPASDIARMNVEMGSPRLDISDAVRIARKVVGLDP